MNKLAEQYKGKIRLKLKDELKLGNIMAVPKVQKVVINIGFGKLAQDKQWVELSGSILERISGQKPIFTKSKKSISNFKIRQGMVIGAKVTLHGARMYDFLDKLVNSTLPRLRDFYGLDLKKGFDHHGNYTLGFKEHIFFPEISMDDVDKIHGLEVTIVTSAKDDKQTLTLLRAFGFPFKKDKK
ncbi:MAG: 50S ribosomal protein L5 [Candidatus Komeilibacteria bacterium CG11_big_fil_rev_8_21_14_0_20_36_20]|uniref:Large ribosomal subunit protein uL5 n=1 Tax=Candidatus Komeilibacteria bacterium CG11_big_fil_rev_8_21_14_0_20_36_20 TaxID=1974477 RepID=A0A2H0NDP8_9BACT|nr:MAG: 50S ribosomal protein L5 [Candidatus Komeilibacteria bacterium CG11_big_fil_rev_8_21_14_0_20_36_20]PIR81394.1 MAG: 50S ribosomal protein L5 [Candidatus Komeilibacteria bacterium CG10_big_fil_rev_8_21_14_0_10_36_65]PJC55119.1 MAG: 50S ribosomal protein L5 [Candidatus Komeilibacteria bacterium CG_4_9_14_0_2_um_filter_36_13]